MFTAEITFLILNKEKNKDQFNRSGQVKWCFLNGMIFLGDETSDVFIRPNKRGLQYDHHNFRCIYQQNS